MPSLLNFQIIIDLVFFVIIVFLLRQLNKNISHNSSAIDTSIIQELRKTMMDSNAAANQFIEVIEENKRVLSKLFLQLDDKEKKLTTLVGEAEKFIKKLDPAKAESDVDNSGKRHESVLKMIHQGLSLDEVSKRSGFTEAEINLIVDLAQAGTDHTS
jgi:hypothetical protein